MISQTDDYFQESVITSYSPSTPITVLIVDDHQIVLEGLRSILSEDPGVSVVGEARDGAEAIAQALKYKPNVILMDIMMPGMNGIEATIRLKAQLPCTRVVMLTMYSADTNIIESVRAGAVGYVLKDASKELLCETIRNANAGHVLVKSEMLRHALTVMANVRGQALARGGEGLANYHLSERELDVLKLVTEGWTNRQIGTSLMISEETVKKHMQNIITKLGAQDRTNAAVKAIRSGLVN
ncbi:MAG: response regulator transcription factor [Chloroflexi bacterium]|jgi:DNA-binding NarL/FixJ family response regulator|uniref:Response regulator transcription factor n=1 Tax=Candidatus Chlorohelix allophototropha TaxID=3003348 RepID=A0A8T7M7B8_9CHLR|nr:response regulator transcription factor [Chloroflexota bacterium]WJW69746.1 response regulator transcription factor [Chloroflexota bacterium L227-S17]